MSIFEHSEKNIRWTKNTYLLVAEAFQVMHNPMMKKTRPCINAVEGSSGNANSKIAAIGIAEPELIWDRIILPELGKRFARISPIFPPKRAPSEPEITKRVMINAVVSWEKPISSSHIGENDQADPGNDPETP